MLRTAIRFATVNRTALCKEWAKLPKRTSAQLLAMEHEHSAHNYHPLPVVFDKVKGMVVTDPEGKKYYDCLSGYGAVSQGHLHPRLINVVKKQLKKCSLSARAFHNSVFPLYAEFVTKFFGYDMVLPMNTGAEGVETGLKLARKWSYKVKGVKANKAKIVCCSGNFHGRTFGAITMSDDPTSYENYGPLVPGFIRVKYGKADELEAVFKKHHKEIAGFIIEPVQGEAGVIVPPKGYLKKVRSLCTKYNILMIADEVQSGVGRTGKMLACDHEGVRPDILVMAKALGGGVLPVAAVLADKPIMTVIEPGTHGSTFGGNPVACALAIESLRVMHDEGMVENSAKMGKALLEAMQKYQAQYPFIKEVRGLGLFCAMEFDEKILDGHTADKLMYMLKEHGMLAKTTHGNIIRITPPLCMKEKQLADIIRILGVSLEELKSVIEAAKKN